MPDNALRYRCAARENWWGEEAFVPDQTYDASAASIVSLTVWRIPSRQLRDAAYRNPEIFMMLTAVTLERKRILLRRTALIATNDVERRILLTLSELGNKGHPRPGNGGYSIPLTQMDVANLIAQRERLRPPPSIA